MHRDKLHGDHLPHPSRRDGEPAPSWESLSRTSQCGCWIRIETSLPFGVVGEICFAGKGVVRGYLDCPELTAEKFVEIEGDRFYRTGDMGRLHPDGNLEILGRRDFQVELRGIRVELAGIEKTVLELGLATQCAVVAKTLTRGTCAWSRSS